MAPHPCACISARSTSGQRPSLRGLMAGAAPTCSATVGYGVRAGPRGGRACPWPSGLRQALAGLPPLQALVRQPFPLRGARAARGLILLPQHPLLSHIHKCLVQPSKSRPQNGPSGVCGQPPPPQGQRCHTGWMPADTAHQACKKDESCNCCFCSSLSSHSTFSAEALTQRCPGLSQPQAASQGSSSFLSWESTAGMSRKNVPVDMYIPQCCNFVCSNHVNTCMDFIIYILYKSIKAYF